MRAKRSCALNAEEGDCLMLKLRQILSNLRASFWFLPSLIVLVSTILAIALIEADNAGSDRWRVVDRAI